MTKNRLNHFFGLICRRLRTVSRRARGSPSSRRRRRSNYSSTRTQTSTTCLKETVLRPVSCRQTV